MRDNESSRTRRLGRTKCSDLVVYPEAFFYPYTYVHGDMKKLFEKNAMLDVSRLIDSYSVHFYGSLSKDLVVHINDKSVYEYLAAQNCPVTYNHVKQNSITFD